MTDRLPKIPPSQAIARIQQAIGDLQTRLKAERGKEHQRAELVAFLQKRPALNRRDLIHALDAVGRGKRARGEGPVLSAHAHRKIGRTIAEARKAKGLTAAQLGKRIGVSGGAVGYWEAGRGLPRPQLRGRIAKLLGLSKGTLANGDGRAHIG